MPLHADTSSGQPDQGAGSGAPVAGSDGCSVLYVKVSACQGRPPFVARRGSWFGLSWSCLLVALDSFMHDSRMQQCTWRLRTARHSSFVLYHCSLLHCYEELACIVALEAIVRKPVHGHAAKSQCCSWQRRRNARLHKTLPLARCVRGIVKKIRSMVETYYSSTFAQNHPPVQSVNGTLLACCRSTPHC